MFQQLRHFVPSASRRSFIGRIGSVLAALAIAATATTVIAPPAAACQSGKQGCSVFDPCCSGLTCDILGECRHTPGRSGERCGTGVPCASGLVCSAAVAGRCQACKTGGQGCGITGGGGTCCSGLVCDVIGECRHSPGRQGEPCGAGVPCASNLVCSAAVGGRCEACRTGGQSCGITGGGGTCCSNLVCDVIGECRHTPGQQGEPCGLGVPCADGLGCSATVGGRCEACKTAGQGCGITGGGGNCCSNLVCDVIGECRHERGELGEPCGLGVPCADGLGCSATVGGRCEPCKSARQACGVFGGGGECCTADDLVCDFLGECRHSVPELDEPCGIGVPCASPWVCPLTGGRCVHNPAEEGELCDLDGFGGAQCGDGLTCQAGIPQRCVPQKSIGEACFSTFNCLPGLECLPVWQQCYPNDGETLFDDQECRSYYRADVHQTAKDGNVALSFGYGSAASSVVSRTYELGVVYGPDGRYGCFLTSCSGFTGDAEIGSFASAGVYNDYDVFAGSSYALVEEAGEGVVFSTSQIFSDASLAELIGTEDCLSIEISAAPIAAGGYFCSTIVDTVYPVEADHCGDGVVDAGEECDDGDTSFTPGDSCTARCLRVLCGRPSGVIGIRPSATDALIVLRSAVAIGSCVAAVCDVDGDGRIGAVDALAILRSAVTGAALPCDVM